VCIRGRGVRCGAFSFSTYLFCPSMPSMLALSSSSFEDFFSFPSFLDHNMLLNSNRCLDMRTSAPPSCTTSNLYSTAPPTRTGCVSASTRLHAAPDSDHNDGQR
jgi:hypothetical protein